MKGTQTECRKGRRAVPCTERHTLRSREELKDRGLAGRKEIICPVTRLGLLIPLFEV